MLQCIPMSDFAKKVKARRKELGMTQAELASTACLTQGMISLIEAGKKPNPGRSTLISLENALELPTGGLLGAEIDPVLLDLLDSPQGDLLTDEEKEFLLQNPIKWGMGKPTPMSYFTFAKTVVPTLSRGKE